MKQIFAITLLLVTFCIAATKFQEIKYDLDKVTTLPNKVKPAYLDSILSAGYSESKSLISIQTYNNGLIALASLSEKKQAKLSNYKSQFIIGINKRLSEIDEQYRNIIDSLINENVDYKKMILTVKDAQDKFTEKQFLISYNIADSVQQTNTDKIKKSIPFIPINNNVLVKVQKKSFRNSLSPKKLLNTNKLAALKLKSLDSLKIVEYDLLDGIKNFSWGLNYDFAQKIAPRKIFTDNSNIAFIDTSKNEFISKRVFNFNDKKEFYKVSTDYNQSGISNSSQLISFFTKKIGSPKVTKVDSTMSDGGIVIKIKGETYEWRNKVITVNLVNLSFIIPESTKKAFIDMMKSSSEIQMLLMGMQMESGISAQQMDVFLEQMMMQQFSQIPSATLSSTITSNLYSKTNSKQSKKNFF